MTRNPNHELYKLITISSLLIISCLLTYYFHFVIGEGVIFTHFFYFPIILAALWWQKKGLIVPIFLTLMLLVSYYLSPNLSYPLYEDIYRSIIFLSIGIVVAILSDVINKKDKELSASEEKFRSVANSAVDGIITTNQNGDIVLMNPSLKRIFGYDLDEIKGRNVTMLMPERYKKDFETKLQNFNSTGTHELDGKTFESIGLKKNGEEFPFEISVATWGYKTGPYTTSIIRDVADRKLTEHQLQKSIKEKEMLLKEIHHRVKNNLMIISSLLSLQSRYIKDENSKTIFIESQNRARSMALIHERLYQSTDLKNIDFGDYIQTLAADLYDTYVVDKNLIKMNIETDELNLDIDTSIPLGLILNELVTNSLKHAFSQGDKGTIDIKFKKQTDKYCLEVKDNGKGFPNDIDYKNADSLGLSLITSLSEQIDADLEYIGSPGTSFKISFNEKKFQ
ncbi:sensor histidine kinase [Methanobacterium lacus]|nr:histidine kinase dimerization/phosphoacceptor domain -containing protein [Methanobacterium lacus]